MTLVSPFLSHFPALPWSLPSLAIALLDGEHQSRPVWAVPVHMNGTCAPRHKVFLVPHLSKLTINPLCSNVTAGSFRLFAIQGLIQATTSKDGAHCSALMSCLIDILQYFCPGIPKQHLCMCNPVLSRYYWTFWARVGCCSLVAAAHSWPGWVHWHLGQDFYMCHTVVVLDEALTPEVSPLVGYSSFTVCDSRTFQ